MLADTRLTRNGLSPLLLPSSMAQLQHSTASRTRPFFDTGSTRYTFLGLIVVSNAKLLGIYSSTFTQEVCTTHLQGKHGWRVELAHKSAEGGRGVGGRYGSSDLKCYKCGEPGHFARECHLTVGSGGLGSGRHRSPSPRFRRSPSYGRRSYSPRDWSPRRRNFSSRRGRSYSRSPPYLNGRNGAANGRRRSRSRS